MGRPRCLIGVGAGAGARTNEPPGGWGWVGACLPCPASLSVRPRSHARAGFFKADIISPGPFSASVRHHRERLGGFASRVGVASGHARGGAGPTDRARALRRRSLQPELATGTNDSFGTRHHRISRVR